MKQKKKTITGTVSKAFRFILGLLVIFPVLVGMRSSSVQPAAGYEHSIYLTKMGLPLTAILLVITDLSTDGECHVQSSAFSVLCLLCSVSVWSAAMVHGKFCLHQRPCVCVGQRKRLLPLAVSTLTKPPVFISLSDFLYLILSANTLQLHCNNKNGIF